MQIEFLSALLYGSPDQIMTVTSGLASALGLLLIFWNKMTGLFFRAVRALKGSPKAAAEKPSLDHQ